ncbi:DUF3311 domain-containing protein [Pseudonocardia phyllosphaerae]|uniref:DUF3311 domain-containing protein n=1 Tax=Pseudonocardia phyllosphaerae TaxID=3390502 RepID=UPI00397B9988
MTDTDVPPERRRRGSGRGLRFGLAVLPWLGFLGGVPFANRVEPYVLGLPFLLFWVVTWVVLTAVCMSLVYVTDPVNRTRDPEAGARR